LGGELLRAGDKKKTGVGFGPGKKEGGNKLTSGEKRVRVIVYSGGRVKKWSEVCQTNFVPGKRQRET